VKTTDEPRRCCHDLELVGLRVVNASRSTR